MRAVYAGIQAELARVGFTPPVLGNFVWKNSVQVPQCLSSTGAWNNRGIEPTGAIVDC